MDRLHNNMKCRNWLPICSDLTMAASHQISLVVTNILFIFQKRASIVPELKCIPPLPLIFPESPRDEKRRGGGGGGEDSVRERD